MLVLRTATVRLPDRHRADRAVNTWLGDPIRALQARAIVEVIQEGNLVEETARVGGKLYDGLHELSQRHSGKVRNLRGKGQGTFIAFDAASPAMRDSFIGKMRNSGVNSPSLTRRPR